MVGWFTDRSQTLCPGGARGIGPETAMTALAIWSQFPWVRNSDTGVWRLCSVSGGWNQDGGRVCGHLRLRAPSLRLLPGFRTLRLQDRGPCWLLAGDSARLPEAEAAPSLCCLSSTGLVKSARGPLWAFPTCLPDRVPPTQGNPFCLTCSQQIRSLNTGVKSCHIHTFHPHSVEVIPKRVYPKGRDPGDPHRI